MGDQSEPSLSCDSAKVDNQPPETAAWQEATDLVSQPETAKVSSVVRAPKLIYSSLEKTSDSRTGWDQRRRLIWKVNKQGRRLSPTKTILFRVCRYNATKGSEETVEFEEGWEGHKFHSGLLF